MNKYVVFIPDKDPEVIDGMFRLEFIDVHREIGSWMYSYNGDHWYCFTRYADKTPDWWKPRELTDVPAIYRAWLLIL